MLFRMRWFFLVFSVALVACSSGDKKDSENAVRHLKSAKTYENHGQFRAAMLEARNVVQLTPSAPGGYEVLSGVYNKIGAFGLTIKLLESRSVSSVEIELNLAKAYLASKKYRSAIAVLEPLLNQELTKSSEEIAGRFLAEAYLYVKEGEKFSALLERLKTNQEAKNTVLYLVAARELSEQKVDQAQNNLNEIIMSDAENFEALTLLGDISLFKNDLDGAESFYSKALSTLDNTDVILADRIFVLRRLIEVLVRLGRSVEAYTYQKLLSDANPDSYAAQQKFTEAMQHYIDGDLGEASALLKDLREQYPQDKNSATLLGVVAQKQGENELASQLFDEYLDAETATPSVIQAAALAKLSIQKSDEAVAMLKLAVEQQPDNAGILSTYGLALVELNRNDNEASNILERSLAIDPNQQRLRLALARSYMLRGKQAQALAQLEKANKEKPEDFLIQQAYYRTLAAVDKRDILKQEIDGYRAANKDSARGEFFNGWYELGEKRFDLAVKGFERALVLNDSEINGLAFAGLAQSYESRDDPSKAMLAWEGAIKNNPASLHTYGYWLANLQQQGEFASSLLRLDKMKLPLSYWQPDFVRAKIYQRLGNDVETFASANSAMSKSPLQPEVKALLADMYQHSAMKSMSAADIGSARQSLLKSVELAPTNVSYIANLIKIELDAGNGEAAQNVLDQLLPENIELDVRYYLQGTVHERRGDGVAALASYRNAWALKPSDLIAEAILALLRVDNSQPVRIAEFLNTWVESLPNSIKPVLLQAMAAQSENRVSEAESLYLKALKLESNSPVALNNLAWIYFERGDSKALGMAKRAYEIVPTSPAIMDTYGWILVQSGQVESGHAILVAAANAAPESKDIKEHLALAKIKLN